MSAVTSTRADHVRPPSVETRRKIRADPATELLKTVLDA
jgi:hypothetical protein